MLETEMERVQITSDGFFNTSSNAWKHLWDTRDFSDVTLVSGNGFLVKAHKSVLSFSSSFFSDAFREISHPSPLIYLRGVDHSELQFLMEYIYTGESLVEQELLEGLLSLGQDLGVQGLISVRKDLEDPKSPTEKIEINTGKAENVKATLDSVFDTNPMFGNKDSKNDHMIEDSKEAKCGIGYFPKETSDAFLDEVKTNQIQQTQDSEKRFQDKMLICDQCDFQTNTLSKLNFHNQSKHLGIKYPCDLCNFKATQTQGLRDHRQRKHGIIFQYENKQVQRFICNFCSKELQTRKGLKLHLETKHGPNDLAKCDKCDFKSAIVKNLFNHVQSVHEGIRYSCQQCGLTATTKGNLNIHIRTKHEGRRFKCDQCDHSVTSFHNLTNHKKSKHEEGTNYKCDQCNYQLKTKQRLKIHIMTMHEGIWHECDDCSYRTVTATKLKKHKVIKHSSVNNRDSINTRG